MKCVNISTPFVRISSATLVHRMEWDLCLKLKPMIVNRKVLLKHDAGIVLKAFVNLKTLESGRLLSSQSSLCS